MVNERFPHTIKVTRVEENPDYNPSFGDGEPNTTTVIMDSVCQNQIGNNGDTSVQSKALISDYIAYVPYEGFGEDSFGDRGKAPKVKRADFVEVDDGLRVIKGTVRQFEAGNLGMRIWWNEN